MFTISTSMKTGPTVYAGNVLEDLDAKLDGSFSIVLASQDADLTELSVKDLLTLYNRAASKPLVKFKSKASGAERVWPLLSSLVTEKAAPKPKAKAKRKSRGINVPALDRAIEPKSGTKQAALIDALRTGATMADLVKATSVAVSGRSKSWTEATVRSAIYWDVNKVKGFGVRTEFVDDVAVYHLVEPA